MGKLCRAWLVPVLLSPSFAMGQVGPALQEVAPSGVSSRGAGDAPLLPLESLVGQFNVKIMVVPHNGHADPDGTFQVSGLPIGSTIERAWFFATSFSSDLSEAATVTFDGVNLGSRSPDAESAAGLLPGQILQQSTVSLRCLVPGHAGWRLRLHCDRDIKLLWVTPWSSSTRIPPFPCDK